MEKSQELALTKMRKSKYGDPTLMRFLIARSMDIGKASKMFVQWLKWRSSFVPNGFIAESEVHDPLEARKVFFAGFIKVRMSSGSYQTVQALPSQGPPIQEVRGLYARQKYSKLHDRKSGREIGNEKLIGILDFQQITYKNVDGRALITGFQFLQAYFPERLAKCYILHMPRFFVSIWRMVSYFIEKETLKKIVVVSNEDEKKSLIEEMGEEAVPVEYGGKAKLTAIQDVQVEVPVDAATI